MRKPLLTHWVIIVTSFIHLCRLPVSAGQGSVPANPPESASTEYLGDHPELILSTSQAWGEQGWNVAAHAPGIAGAPLQIGERTYTKGLGHHANGAVQVLLDGEYACFNAEVGLQPCGGGGSVIFRVWVDGEPRFDSGIMRVTNARKMTLQIGRAHV